MNRLPRNLYRAEQVRELDRLAIESFNVPSSVLMERAGSAAFEALRQRWPDAKRIVVLCGTGNNGGDGFVVARLAREAGLEVAIYQLGDPARLQGDALAAAQRLAGVEALSEPFSGHDLAGFDVLVDGMLGTGLRGEVSEHWRAAIEAVNRSGKPVLALDVPSGLDVDSGAARGTAVRAAMTVTFIGMKRGLLMEEGRDYAGDVVFDDLAVPEGIYAQGPPPAVRLELSDFQHRLAPRRRDAHKGCFGHVLVVGGESGFSGAARLAGEAAARMGAGLVSVATRAAHAATINTGRPELMCHGVETASELSALLARASAVVVGPGLGRGAWARELMTVLLDTQTTMVFDADALNLLAEDPLRRDNWILTPHPGEAARLLGVDTPAIQADRFGTVDQLQKRYGGVVVLKGAGTLVRAADANTGLCAQGNPGMASGGMGDILSGILGALLAQGFALHEAAQLGTCLHAAAGDAAAKSAGERGLLASDLLPWIRRLANPTVD